MASSPQGPLNSQNPPVSAGAISAGPAVRKRLPLGPRRHRLSFERRIRLWCYSLGLPAVLLIALQLRFWHLDSSIQWILVPGLILCWVFITSVFMEQIVRPLQTLANVVSALRENDYSFRARGGRRNDSMGDLAIEINALAATLQAQRVGAMEAMALVERVMKSMQSPVLAFDPEGRLKLLNAAAEKAFQLGSRTSTSISAAPKRPVSAPGFSQPGEGQPDIARLLQAEDNELISLTQTRQATRWVVKRTSFRLRGIPHALFVLADVSEALREEERLAWERLIRVLGHEINNSLAPIKSIAGSLRSHVALQQIAADDREDFARGLEVIEDRAESLNRFLQAYRELMGLPAPRLEPVSLGPLVRRIAQLETRLPVQVVGTIEVTLRADPDQLAQALINLIRNAAEAAIGQDSKSGGFAPSANGSWAGSNRAAHVSVHWELEDNDALITVLDNGPGLSNASNLFVPFYTTKPGGTGIGLVLAQQIALAHSGSVQLLNRADEQGCKACLRLPLTQTTA